MTSSVPRRSTRNCSGCSLRRSMTRQGCCSSISTASGFCWSAAHRPRSSVWKSTTSGPPSLSCRAGQGSGSGLLAARHLPSQRRHPGSGRRGRMDGLHPRLRGEYRGPGEPASSGRGAVTGSLIDSGACRTWGQATAASNAGAAVEHFKWCCWTLPTDTRAGSGRPSGRSRRRRSRICG